MSRFIAAVITKTNNLNSGKSGRASDLTKVIVRYERRHLASNTSLKLQKNKYANISMLNSRITTEGWMDGRDRISLYRDNPVTYTLRRLVTLH